MKSVFISAGHSNVDPGAVGFGRREADIAVDFRNKVAFYLDRARIPFEMDGSGTKNLPLRDAVVKAKKHPIGAEFHCNASNKSTATGVEVLCGPDDYSLGAKICVAIANSLGIRNRGVKPENAGQHHRLAFVQAGGMIVELFFISNSDDLRKYDEKSWLMASAVANVLIDAANR